MATIFSVHVLYISSSVRLSSVVCLSVTFVRPAQAIEIFGNVSTPLVRWPSADIQVKFYRDRPRGTPPSGELNTRGRKCRPQNLVFGDISFMAILAGVIPSESDKVRHSALASENLTNNQP